MSHALKFVRVSKQELRELFRAPSVEGGIVSGELRPQLLREGHPSPKKSGEPFCTRSQILAFYDYNNTGIAVCHQYLRPDGRIGASGKMDPKRVSIRGTVYFVG
jgi:hypothetical protein